VKRLRGIENDKRQWDFEMGRTFDKFSVDCISMQDSRFLKTVAEVLETT
jgi:hypothetical protein